MKHQEVITALHNVAKPHRVVDLQRFYKTAPGEYGHGDVFLGILVPVTRTVAAQFSTLSLKEISKLLKSPFHEARLCALVIITNRFKKSKEEKERVELFDFYLDQVRKGNVNNWDLVDVSAPAFGEHLVGKKEALPLLKKLAKSDKLWERRVSIVLTFGLIRHHDLMPTVIISAIHLKDKEDLIHKASGWMLREMGKKNLIHLQGFLKEHAHEMPRTMLRYSIEKLPEKERQKWLKFKG